MPELPDVETFKRYLSATALHHPIDSVSQLDERILDGVSASTVRRHLLGAELESTRRHGKHLLVELSSGRWLILHFGMTGFVRYYRDEDAGPGHVRARLDFDNGYHLAFDCQRLFGFVRLAGDADRYIQEQGLGADALALDAGRLAELLGGKRTSVKAALMDQNLIAGIGNVYSDEICFRAGIDPRRRCQDLSDDELKALHRSLHHVLDQAIEVKADPGEMPRSWITPQRSADEPQCPRCGGELETHKVNQRTAYLCPRCQR